MCDGQGGNEKGVPQIEVTPEMVDAGFVLVSKFNSDITDLMPSNVVEAMLVAVYTAMTSVYRGEDAKSGIRRGLELRSSQEVISPSRLVTSQAQ